MPGDDLEAVARALLDHFALAGGVPLVATFEWPAVGDVDTDTDADAPDFTSALAHLALELGVGIELPSNVPSRGPRLSRAIRNGFLRQLRPIASEADLMRQLATWVNDVNTNTPDREASPVSLLVEERSRLRPLRVARENLTLRVPIVVRPGGVVLHEGRSYMLPPHLAGSAGTLFSSEREVRIIVGAVTSIFSRVEPSLALSGSANPPRRRAASE